MPTISSMLMGFFSVALVFQSASNYRVVGRYPVPGDGGFDYVTLDSFLKGAGVSRRPHEPPALRSGGGTAHS